MLLMGLHLLFAGDVKLYQTGGWWHAKIVLWLALGAAPTLAKRKVLPPVALVGIVLGIAALAVFLANYKPF